MERRDRRGPRREHRGNRQPLETRLANGRFFFGNESREGYECVPIALVERSGQGKNTPVLSTEFIPPVTEIGACRASRTSASR